MHCTGTAIWSHLERGAVRRDIFFFFKIRENIGWKSQWIIIFSWDHPIKLVGIWRNSFLKFPKLRRFLKFLTKYACFVKNYKFLVYTLFVKCSPKNAVWLIPAPYLSSLNVGKRTYADTCNSCLLFYHFYITPFMCELFPKLISKLQA